LIAGSLLAWANAIVTQLMVVQGNNDRRVNIRRSHQIVAAIRDDEKPGEISRRPIKATAMHGPSTRLQ
jgi:hypothetical protein